MTDPDTLRLLSRQLVLGGWVVCVYGVYGCFVEDLWGALMAVAADTLKLLSGQLLLWWMLQLLNRGSPP